MQIRLPGDAVILECSFPDRLAQLAKNAGHLTSNSLAQELTKLSQRDFAAFAMHLKPAYRDEIIPQLAMLNLPGVTVMLPRIIQCKACPCLTNAVVKLISGTQVTVSRKTTATPVLSSNFSLRFMLRKTQTKV